ncbi:MAG: sulfite exporter TauE/SafE family protein [Spirochaetaceae bacterium]|nr:MAG: sulfite exporter TauE/SafE family protein [Spirochaetaceae bacterium]
MQTVLALLFGSAMGLSLGLTGGGGSILAVPLLVYGLGLDLRAAVAVSLAVVGLTALFGAVIQARSGQVLWRAGALLGGGGIIAAPFGARLGAVMPDDVVLVLFALLMVVVGVRMARGSSDAPELPLGRFRCPRGDDGRPQPTLACMAKLAGAGAVAGVLSGFFGVGGGFLLVPALVWVGSVRIEHALATSLVAIALIAVSGFAANVGAAGHISLTVATLFGAGGAAGMVIGARLKRYLSAVVLSRVFAAVAIAAGFYVVAQVVL